jgi:hypothetical protein
VRRGRRRDGPGDEVVQQAVRLLLLLLRQKLLHGGQHLRRDAEARVAEIPAQADAEQREEDVQHFGRDVHGLTSFFGR